MSAESLEIAPPCYWDGTAAIYQGDCEQVLAGWLAGRSGPDAHIVVTSPPYNMGLSPSGGVSGSKSMRTPSKECKGSRFRDGYDQHGDDLPQEEYDALHRRILGLLWETIPEDGAIFWNHRQRLEHGTVRLPLGMNFGIPLRQIITWDRGTGIGANLRHFASVAEWVFLFAKPEFQLRDYSVSGFGDVWRLGMARKTFQHPAPFPVALPLRAIESVPEPRHVLDPFAGSGTTLVAAKQAGVPSAGIELSEIFCAEAARRLASTPWFGEAL